MNKIFDQIAFIVKHEAVGGQGEVLARCLFQIADLVPLCKYANYLVLLFGLVWFGLVWLSRLICSYPYLTFVTFFTSTS